MKDLTVSLEDRPGELARLGETLGLAGIKVEGEDEPMIAEFPADQIDRPGSMGVMARAIADAGVNVKVVYLATRNRGVMVTSDNKKARAALGM